MWEKQVQFQEQEYRTIYQASGQIKIPPLHAISTQHFTITELTSSLQQ
jgi:hypothetical protein